MRVISSTSDLREFCQQLSGGDYVTVDTEFLREQTFWPQLCLIQLAGADAEAIIDPMANGLSLDPFFELMADGSVVKVFHAARQDIEIIHKQAGVVPNPVFDTQIAAMVCGFGESISYVNLVKRVTGLDLDKSSRFTDWSRRPLSTKQLEYAIGDVTHLRDVYLHLHGELQQKNRAAWVDEEMSVLTSSETYETDPENAWRRLKARTKGKKSFAVLIELAAWRERQAQEQDVPRGRILRDDALYDIANQIPETTDDLGKLRTLSDGFARSSRARDIIKAVKAGLERNVQDLPRVQRAPVLTAEATATLELLKVLLKTAAAKHGVAPRIIADSEDLEKLASSDAPDVKAVQGWRGPLFGDAALKLKRGELALTLVNGKVREIPTTPPSDLDPATPDPATED